VPVAYAADSLALAALEVLVGVQRSALLAAYSVVAIRFDEHDVETIPRRELPSGWRRYPAPAELQRLGDRWVAEGRSFALRVPSAIIPTESNFLLNPAHAGFAEAALSPPAPFEFDPRLAALVRNEG
jgi:RES domain-containing protein